MCCSLGEMGSVSVLFSGCVGICECCSLGEMGSVSVLFSG